MTGISAHTVNQIYDRAVERGWDPSNPKILNKHVEDAPKSGRPSKKDQYSAEVLQKARHDGDGRDKTCEEIAKEIGSVSAMTVWRILYDAGFHKTKPTQKPGCKSNEASSS